MRDMPDIWSHEPAEGKKKERLTPREWKKIFDRVLLSLAMMAGSADNYARFTTGHGLDQYLPPSLSGELLNRAFNANHVCRVSTPNGHTLIDIKVQTPEQAFEDQIKYVGPRMVWFDYPDYTVRCTFSLPGDMTTMEKQPPAEMDEHEDADEEDLQKETGH